MIRNGDCAHPQKGDKLKPEIYRAIALLSIPGLVFSRLILNRMQDKIDDQVTELQFGFRRGRGTVDAIFVTQIKKYKSSNTLHFNVVDFKAAFDTKWRTALWKMRSIAVNTKPVNLMEALYENTQCAMLVNGQLKDWFKVEVGVSRISVVKD